MQFGCIPAPRQTAQNGSANDDVSRYLSTPVHFHPVPPCLNWCRGGEGPRQLCSRLGINVHFPTDGRIVTTTRVMEATLLPARSLVPPPTFTFSTFSRLLCRPVSFSPSSPSPHFFHLFCVAALFRGRTFSPRSEPPPTHSPQEV